MLKMVLFLVTLFFSVGSWAITLEWDDLPDTVLPKAKLNLKLTDYEVFVNEKAWVGIFKRNRVKAKEAISWKYLHENDKGFLEFFAPVFVGHYEVRILARNNKPIADIPPLFFDVNVMSKEGIDLKINQQKFLPNEFIHVFCELKDLPPKSSWLGIFPENTVVQQTSGRRSDVIKPIAYQTLKRKKINEMKFNVPEKAGRYAIWFFDGYPGNPVKNILFEVENLSDVVSLSFKNKSVEPESIIHLEYVIHETHVNTAWVGIFEREDSEKSWTPVNSKHKLNDLQGEVALVAPGLKGDYEIRLMSSEKGIVLAKQGFKVLRSLDADLLKSMLDNEGQIRVYGIYFDFNQSLVSPESKPALQAIASMMNKFSELTISIEGHTDNRGDAEYNITLSEARALAILTQLVEEYGIDKSRMSAEGFGESRPIEDNKTTEGRRLNRRVEIKRQR